MSKFQVIILIKQLRFQAQMLEHQLIKYLSIQLPMLLVMVQPKQYIILLHHIVLQLLQLLDIRDLAIDQYVNLQY